MNFTNSTEYYYYGSDTLKEISAWYGGYHGFVSVVVCVFGIVTNIFNIVVLTQQNMLSPTNTILTGLAISDMLTMICYVPMAVQFYCLYGVTQSPERNSLPWVRFLLFNANFTNVTHTTSIWLGVTLAIFRYMYVRFSTEGALLCGMVRSKVAVYFVYGFSIVILVPNYLSLRVVKVHGGTNQTMYDLRQIPRNTTYGQSIIQLNFWIHASLVKLIPCGLMLLFGWLLVYTLRDTHRKGKKLRYNGSIRSDSFKTRQRDHARTTRMYIIVIVLFLVTELPQGILALCSGLMEGFFVAVYTPLGDFMDILALINNSINFALYCSMSKQFRETFVQIFLADLWAKVCCSTNNNNFDSKNAKESSL